MKCRAGTDNAVKHYKYNSINGRSTVRRTDAHFEVLIKNNVLVGKIKKSWKILRTKVAKLSSLEQWNVRWWSRSWRLAKMSTKCCVPNTMQMRDKKNGWFGIPNPLIGCEGACVLPVPYSMYVFLFFLFRFDKMPHCRYTHPPTPNNGVFQAIVAPGTHPVYLNPSAHSAVKPWHGGSSTPILHPCIWHRVGSGGKDVSNEINPKSAWKAFTLMACRYMYLTLWLACIHLCRELWCIYSSGLDTWAEFFSLFARRLLQHSDYVQCGSMSVDEWRWRWGGDVQGN